MASTPRGSKATKWLRCRLTRLGWTTTTWPCSSCGGGGDARGRGEEGGAARVRFGRRWEGCAGGDRRPNCPINTLFCARWGAANGVLARPARLLAPKTAGSIPQGSCGFRPRGARLAELEAARVEVDAAVVVDLLHLRLGGGRSVGRVGRQLGLAGRLGGWAGSWGGRGGWAGGQAVGAGGLGVRGGRAGWVGDCGMRPVGERRGRLVAEDLNPKPSTLNPERAPLTLTRSPSLKTDRIASSSSALRRRCTPPGRWTDDSSRLPCCWDWRSTFHRLPAIWGVWGGGLGGRVGVSARALKGRGQGPPNAAGRALQRPKPGPSKGRGRGAPPRCGPPRRPPRAPRSWVEGGRGEGQGARGGVGGGPGRGWRGGALGAGGMGVCV